MKLTRGKGSVFGDAIILKFQYDPQIISKIKSFKRYAYNPQTKEWELPSEYEQQIRDTFADELAIIDVGEAINLPPVHVEHKYGELPKDFKFKSKPYEHQIDAIRFAMVHDSFLLGDEMGLGKSFQALNIALTKPIKKCLIICGINGLKWNWRNEVSKFTDKTSHFIGEKHRKNGNIYIGTAADKIKDIESLSGSDDFFIITNVETLRQSKVISALSRACDNGEIGMIILDEAHKCTNNRSLQGKGLVQLNPKYKLPMTGTPLMNRPTDLYLLLNWLGIEKRNFWSFRKHYCVLQTQQSYGRNYEAIIGYQNLEELQLKTAKIMLRRKKEEVLDLPEKIFVDEYVEMSEKQKDLYEQAKLDVISKIETLNSHNALTETLRMRQVTSVASSIDPKCDTAKLDRMEELVDEAVENGKQVVIFSNWATVIKEVKRRLARYNPAMIIGEVSEDERNLAEKRFQNHETKVLCGTIGSAGTGLTFTAGSVEIFIDEPWTMAVKNQAVDRCHRIGQKESVLVYTLLTKDTIDESVHSLLALKQNLSDALVDNASIRKLIGC
ncbi:MAG: DEAD/DEAH box helicase [Firmicutes bacterium]|nr:DEAD/DEAH box helicase [Bacillota bacterium]